MSTPPPPQQPPAGGFGAPQGPPPGGFGAPPPTAPPVPPQQPPAGAPPQPPVDPRQPAGAPPQAPPPAVPPTMPAGGPAVPPQAAPPGQPAYGYPQQGYGYPQQGPAAPNPYSAPTAPMQAAPPQPVPSGAGGGGDKRTQTMIIGAAALAVVLIVAGGLWYASGSGGGDEPAASPTSGGSSAPAGAPGSEKVPANTKSRPLYNQPSPAPEEITSVPGSWLTDSTYVKTDVSKVVGYNVVDGGKKWELPFPGEVCGATKHVSDDKTAVLYKAAAATPQNKYPPCTEVGVIDLNTGKLLWSGNAKGSATGDQPASLNEVTISGQTVAAAGTSGGAAWNLADGKSLWTPKVDPDGCYDAGYAGGEGLAVIRKCGRYPSQTLYAQSLNPTTGAPTASYKLSEGIEWASIISTKPLVVAADVGGTAKNATGISDLFVVDPKGELKARISLASGNFGGKCRATEIEKCTNIVVGNGKVYLPSIEHQGKDSSLARTNELLSFDLETGKQTSDRADAGERYTMFPLRMDGSNIIAYKVPPYDKGGQVVSINGTTMKETLLMENPAEKASRTAETGFSPEFSEFRYHNGKLFISRTNVKKPFSDKSDPEYLFVSFSAS
ncbi:outer membrane protein assembly factor BamB family protein [Streptomyces sp. NPDC004244]|uniref:outer membrane protein assembly factor BamB family protein n=1 Tax=Streptomyces sp. NPDC101206 TaxID=3366128 RepID=UPI0038036FC7